DQVFALHSVDAGVNPADRRKVDDDRAIAVAPQGDAFLGERHPFALVGSLEDLEHGHDLTSNSGFRWPTPRPRRSPGRGYPTIRRTAWPPLADNFSRVRTVFQESARRMRVAGFVIDRPARAKV